MYPPCAPHQLKENIHYVAQQLGFSLFGVTPSAPPAHGDLFLNWRNKGYGGEMNWLTKDPERRLNPELVLPEAKSIIILSTTYRSLPCTSTEPQQISRYAQGLDYHDLLDTKLKDLDQFLQEYGGIQRCYSDTGPILERDFAVQAGLGWCGKSNLLIHPQLGSATFLSVILTSLELPADTPQPSRCGFCQRCLDACPTGALKTAHELDARACLAYLTIEHRGPIPLEYRRQMGSRLYGCDACLQACPWNHKSRSINDLRYSLNQALLSHPLRSYLSWNESDFTIAFKGSPIKRIKLSRFLRNICIVLGNVGTNDDIPALIHHTHSENEIIAEHATWAINEIRQRHLQ